MSVYTELGLQKIINASGRMTALGVSTVSDTVLEALKEGAQNYVDIEELYIESGKKVSEYTGGENSLITSSASAGIAMSVAGLIAKDNMKLIRQLPDSTGLVNEVIIPKGHVVDFGAPVTSMIRIGGGKPVEAGLANKVTLEDIKNEITDKTVALMYIKSHHTVQKGMVKLQDLVTLSQETNIPLIVDAAAEEDLKKYIQMGATVVIYSGAKALEGPTSGIITGRKDIIDWARLQYKGIGRPMKVGKESIVGLLKALEQYNKKDEVKEVEIMRSKVAHIIASLSDIETLRAEEIQDEAGREIYRVQLKVKDAFAFDRQLKAGDISIHTRSHRLNEGYISIDVRSLSDEDIKLLIEKVRGIAIHE